MNTENVPPKIYFTTDLKIFKPHFFQRDIQQNHLASMIKTLKEENLLKKHPIEVTPNMEVTDGGHRLAAAKILKLPGIYYIINYKFNPEEIVRINRYVNPWGYYDFLQYYIKKENDAYIRFKKFLDDTKMSINMALPLTQRKAHRKNNANNFKDGKFLFENEEFLRTLTGNVYEFLNQASLLGLVKKSTNTTTHFFDAYAKLLDYKEFSHEKMMQKLQKYGIVLIHSGNLTGYYNQLVSLYNRNGKKDVLPHMP